MNKLVTIVPILVALARSTPAVAADTSVVLGRVGLHGGRGQGQGKGKGKGKGGHGDGGPGKGKGIVIVQLRRAKEDRGDPAHRDAVAAACADVAAAAGGALVHAYDRVLFGCAIRLPAATTAAATAAVAADARVAAVADDGEARALSPWGVDRLNQCGLPLDGVPAAVNATGVRVYVVDSGVYGAHEDFPAAVLDPTSACHADMTGGGDPLSDDNGHGTHVAGTACGAIHGVAACDDLCAVKVLAGADLVGPWSDVIAGINHVVGDCADAVPPRPCVANLSLGGPRRDDVDAAVADAVAAGVVVVAAAGNERADACATSPARVPDALTVGSTTRRDRPSWFSNYGECVDVYGPGSDVTSAGTAHPTATDTISGTSMASPHVAGIVAGLLREDPALGPAGVAERLRRDAAPLAARAPDGAAILLATAVGGCRAPTPAPTPLSCAGEDRARVSVDVATDAWATETAWELRNNCDASQPAVIGAWDLYRAASTRYSHHYCLPVAEYTFTIRDSFGDGLCCDAGTGGYTVNVDGVAMASGGNFAFSETSTFGSCE